MGKKALAPRKRPRSSGAGSSSIPRPPPTFSDEHRHKFRDMIHSKIFKPNALFSWPVMRSYGLARDFQFYFTDPAWEQLFSINEKTYKGVTLEFLSSFSIAFPFQVNGLNNEVSFSAFGKYYTIPMLQFCAYTGLYSDEQMQDDAFQHLENTWSQPTSMADFWRSISTKGPYNSSKSRGTHLKTASARLLHWLLVHSLNGRISSTSVVSHQDLFAMYSMITGTRTNVAIQLAFAIRHQTQAGNRGVFCGAFITRILKNMGIFPAEEPGDFACISFKMTGRTLDQWGIPKVSTGDETSTPSHGQADMPSASSIQQLQTEMQSLRKQQDKILKGQDKILRRQKGLKQFMMSSLKAIAEKIKATLPDCISTSSSDDQEELERSSPIHDPRPSGDDVADDVAEDDLDREIDTFGEAEGEEGTEIIEEGSTDEDAGTQSP